MTTRPTYTDAEVALHDACKRVVRVERKYAAQRRQGARVSVGAELDDFRAAAKVLKEGWQLPEAESD